MFPNQKKTQNLPKTQILLIPVFLQPNCVNLWNFRSTRYVLSAELCFGEQLKKYED